MEQKKPYDLEIRRDFSVDASGALRFAACVTLRRTEEGAHPEPIYSTWIYGNTVEELEARMSSLKRTLRSLIDTRREFIDRLGRKIVESI